MELRLNEAEEQIFSVLQKVVQDKSPNTVLRAAGGWVRDKLMGRGSQDIDIAVDNMSGHAFAQFVFDWMKTNNVHIDHKMAVVKSNPDKSKHLETTILPMFGVPIDFVQLRKETYDANGEQSRIPTIETDVSAEDDALRRDFTMNAMFFNLHTSEIEDLTGHGREDLKRGVLRTPLDPIVTFLQDPLRILRAIRFAAKFGFVLDESLKKAALDSRVQHAFKHKLSEERIWREMIGSQESEGFKAGFLVGPNPAYAAELMKELGIRDLLFTLSSEERKFLGVEQDDTSHWDAEQNNPHHNLTIWNHTVRALDHLVQLSRADESDFEFFDPTEETVRNLSILLHDIGKCDLCARQTKVDGSFSYLGHAESSAKMAAYLLETRLKAPNEIIERVRNIVYHHMRLHTMEDRPTTSALRRAIKDVGKDWLILAYHSIADAMGKDGVSEDPKYRAMIARMKEIQVEQGGKTKPKRPIDGLVIMKELGLKPGPAVGVVTNALDEVLLENPALTADEAIAFIKTVRLE